jgi:hypothetical protein
MIAEKWHKDGERSLVNRAKTSLSNSKIAAIRNLRVESDAIGVVLLGQVPLYYYKQLAQELVRSELDDTSIINQIEVVAPR